MASSRVLRTAVLLAASALVVLRSAPAAAATRLTVLVVDENVWQTIAQLRPVEPGVGVYPDSRDPVEFVEEIGRGAPSGGSRATAPRLTLAQALADAGVRVKTLNAGGPLGDALERAFVAPASPAFEQGAATDLTVHVVSTYASAAEAIDSSREPLLLLGLREHTPIWVGRCLSPCPEGGARDSLAVLDDGIARRPGIVTPYDFAATVIAMLDVRLPEGFIGRPLGGTVYSDPLNTVRSWAARFQRDDSYAPGLAAVTVTLGVGSIILGLALAGLGRKSAGARVAQAAVFVLPGWVVAIFVPSGRWEVRGLVVLAAVLAGSLLKPRDPVRAMAFVGFGSAVAFAVLVAVAPLNPGGEPALSIWGNPLVSWRFFGLQNVPAAIIASGVVVWGMIRGLAPAMLAGISVVAAVIIGAPTIGANFVGVLTFVFGAAVAVTALVRKRVALREIVGSAVIAAGAFVLALLADAGSPVSHGGRAARRISSGGWSAAWDLIEGRLRLNLELIRDFTGGVAFVPLLVITLAALIAWGMRVERGPVRARVAVLGGALMALASLVLEDSGFYSGAVLWFVAADAWLLVTLASSVTPRATLAPSDDDG